MRIGVIGLGFMGSAHLQALAKIPGAEVIAVMSRNEKRLSGDLSDVQGNLDVPSVAMDFSTYCKYRDVTTMLQDPDIEAVDVCLPTYLHEATAIDALQAGKHVLLEKPMALNGTSAYRIIEQAHRSQRTLMVAQVLRFMSPYQALSELVQSGRLGIVRSAIFRRRTAVPTWGEWEFDRAKSGGGVYDLLIHDVDMVLHLFGLPRQISATGFENLSGGVDNITSQFHYDHIDSVTISGGWHHSGQYPFSMEYTVVADNGVVEFASNGRPATVYWHDGSYEVLPASDSDPYADEIAYFLECCRTGVKPIHCPPSESAMAVEAAQMMVDAREKKGDKVSCEFRAV